MTSIEQVEEIYKNTNFWDFVPTSESESLYKEPYIEIPEKLVFDLLKQISIETNMFDGILSPKDIIEKIESHKNGKNILYYMGVPLKIIE